MSASIRPAIRPDLGNRRGLGVGAFVLALATAGALVHVGVRMKAIEAAYALGRERHRNADLEEQRRRLNIEIGMLKDPMRVVEIARDTLEMGPPAIVMGTLKGSPNPPAKGLGEQSSLAPHAIVGKGRGR